MHSFFTQNWRWLATGALLTLTSSIGQTYFISLFADDIKAQYQLSDGQWGSIYAAGTLLSSFAMFWLGSVIDRLAIRTMASAVFFALALAACFMAYNQNATLLIAVIFCLRLFGQGLSTHTAMVAMGRWFSANRGRAIAIAGLGFSLGEATLPKIIAHLKLSHSFTTLWLWAASFALCAIVAVQLLLKHERKPDHGPTEDTSATATRSWTRREVMHSKGFWLLVPLLMAPGAFNTTLFFHQIAFVQSKGWTLIEWTTLIPLFTLTAVASALVWGYLVDRYTARRLIPWFSWPMVFGLLMFSMATSLSHALIGLMLMALMQGGAATVLTAMWAELFGTKHLGANKVLGMVLMVIGSAAGPAISGLAMDSGISLAAQFPLMALWVFAAIVLAWRGLRHV
ncbi:MAG: MFS transporter [Gammaproteobacteria bacterium]|nr:MFS transporter [Gammaproteobacteria bacterium]